MRPRIPFLLLITLLAFTLIFTGCDSKPSGSGIKLLNPKANPAPPGAPTGAIYLEISNQGGQDDQLIKVTSPVSSTVEIHQTKIDAQGMMEMRHQKTLTVKAGESVKFEPGGYHLMLVGLKAALPQGSETSVELTFKNAGKISLKVPVTGLMVHGHDMPMDGMHQNMMNKKGEGHPMPKGEMPQDSIHQKAMGNMPMGAGHPMPKGEMPQDSIHQKAMPKDHGRVNYIAE